MVYSKLAAVVVQVSLPESAVPHVPTKLAMFTSEMDKESRDNAMFPLTPTSPTDGPPPEENGPPS